MSSFIYKYRMQKFKLIYLLIIPLLFTAFALSCSKQIIDQYIKEDLTGTDFVTVWALSDIQPYNVSQRKHFENAVKDVNEITKADIALVAGDIANWSVSDEDYKWYLETRKSSSIRYWYEIAGNHDQKSSNYLKYIKKPLHYSIQLSNMLILCLSDETKSGETNISDEAFFWWKDMVINNQDKIIITMTHGYLKQSGMFGTILASRNIHNSERFTDVLKKYRVDLWICGHTHLSHSLGKSMKLSSNLNGTLFMNVSAIRSSSYNDSESYLLYFKKNSDELIVRSRNHDKKEFISYDIFILNKKFIWNGKPPLLEEMKYNLSDK